MTITNAEFVRWFNDGYADCKAHVLKDTAFIELTNIKATSEQQDAYWQGYTAAEEDIRIDDEAGDR